MSTAGFPPSPPSLYSSSCVMVSCDDRIIDGILAGRLLEELKTLLENPIVLVVA